MNFVLKGQVILSVKRPHTHAAKIADQWRNTVVLRTRPLYTVLSTGAPGARHLEIAVYYVCSEQNEQIWTGKVWLECVSWDHPACQFRPHTWSLPTNAECSIPRHTHTHAHTHLETHADKDRGRKTASRGVCREGGAKGAWPPECSIAVRLARTSCFVFFFHFWVNA